MEKNGKADLEKRLLKELRPDGVVNLEQNSLEHLERDCTGDSLAVPVKFNNDGSLSKVSRAVSQEEFHTMMEYADQKAAEIRQQIAGVRWQCSHIARVKIMGASIVFISRSVDLIRSLTAMNIWTERS